MCEKHLDCYKCNFIKDFAVGLMSSPNKLCITSTSLHRCMRCSERSPLDSLPCNISPQMGHAAPFGMDIPPCDSSPPLGQAAPATSRPYDNSPSIDDRLPCDISPLSIFFSTFFQFFSNFTEFHSIPQNFTEFRTISQNFVEFRRISQIFLEFHRISQNFVEFHRIS